MIARIIEFSVRNRWLVIFAWIAIAVWGVYAVLHTPIDAIPDLSENQVIVFTDWMGRSPQDIEDQVTYPLSVQLQGLAGVKVIRSSSEFNFSMITIIFDEKTDYYFARQRVLERLQIASAAMPAGVTPKLAPDATALGQIFWYTVEGAGVGLDELRAIQDWTVRYQLNSVPGVSEVASVGGFVREYQVDVDPSKLRVFNIPLGDIYMALANSNKSVGGKVLTQGKSEYIVRGVGWLQGIADIQSVVITNRSGVPIRLGDVATVQLGPQFRRSALEKNGHEAVGGVVLMRYGENPLAVTHRIKDKIAEIEPGLPAGVRIVPFYDRTRLIESAIHTVTGTLREEMIIATIAIVLILSHLRSAFVVCITLPLAALVSFLFMYYLGISSNIMSLAGIAISIGILVDAAVVMVENATHELHERFGDERVQGDTTELVVRACRLVGRPIFFSVVIMLVSFLPIFAFTGQEGKLSHPLAYTKSFAMIGVAILAVTLVPALIPTFIRGRLSGEQRNRIVRSFIDIYKPLLNWMIDRPGFVWWTLAVILSVGASFIGSRWVPSIALAVGLGFVLLAVRSARGRFIGAASLILIAFVCDTRFKKLGGEFMPTLNEGSLMDMPVAAPRIAMAQAFDDVLVRDRIIRSFPEVEQAVGKIGRAETSTDPSGIEMVETIINLKPHDIWPKRKLKFDDAVDQVHTVVKALQDRGWIQSINDAELNTIAMDVSQIFDRRMREMAQAEATKERNWKLLDAAPAIINDAAIDALLRTKPSSVSPNAREINSLKADLHRSLADRLLLWQKTRDDVLRELDGELQMPGWGNAWTQPIINRVNMLSTGVRTQIGVKVFGPTGKSGNEAIAEIQRVTNEISARLKTIRGAVDVVPDLAEGKRYLEIAINRENAARYGVNVSDISEVIETAIGGDAVTQTVEGRQRFPVRVRYAREYWQDADAIGNILVSAKSSPVELRTGASATAQPMAMQIPLRMVADIRFTEGPNAIKAENGRLRNYVMLNVRDRDIVGFVEEAQRAIKPIEASLAGSGMSIQWSGEFEHQLSARKTMAIIFPLVIAAILFLLYLTFHDVLDTMLVFLAVIGALCGSLMFQAIFGFNFSVVVSIGYVAAFGMATQTGVIMLVYLRDAINRRGGLSQISSLQELRQLVIEGAVHRLRPKLLTEGVAIIGLVPMLWATGTGAEIMRPMAAPVLGGLLISDEVIDILIPVIFYGIRRRRWLKSRQTESAIQDPAQDSSMHPQDELLAATH